MSKGNVMKLFYSKGACSLTIRIIINEIGLKTDFESVSLANKKTETGKDFFTINPKGAVPALQLDNGLILTENAAILQYLADTSHATELFPEPRHFERYRIIEWLNYVATEVHKSFGALFNPTIPQQLKDDLFIPLIKGKLGFINKHLDKNKYLAGDKFTLPDAYLFVMLTWATHFKININEWSHVAKYFDELKQRKSIQQSLKDEGLTKD